MQVGGYMQGAGAARLRGDATSVLSQAPSLNRWAGAGIREARMYTAAYTQCLESLPQQ